MRIGLAGAGVLILAVPALLVADASGCLLEKELSSGATACFTQENTVETAAADRLGATLTLADGTVVEPIPGDYRVTSIALRLSEAEAEQIVWELRARRATFLPDTEPLARVVALEEAAGALFVLYTYRGEFVVDVLRKGPDGAWETTESLDTGLSESFTSGAIITSAGIAMEADGHVITAGLRGDVTSSWRYRPGKALTLLEEPVEYR